MVCSEVRCCLLMWFLVYDDGLWLMVVVVDGVVRVVCDSVGMGSDVGTVMVMVIRYRVVIFGGVW